MWSGFGKKWTNQHWDFGIVPLLTGFHHAPLILPLPLGRFYVPVWNQFGESRRTIYRGLRLAITTVLLCTGVKECALTPRLITVGRTPILWPTSWATGLDWRNVEWFDNFMAFETFSISRNDRTRRRGDDTFTCSGSRNNGNGRNNSKCHRIDEVGYWHQFWIYSKDNRRNKNLFINKMVRKCAAE